MALVFGASGVSASLRGQPSFKYALQAGETMIVPPGTYGVRPGRYSVVQQYNPITTCWENVGGTGTRDYFFIDSDGVNFRVANQSGCLVGALVTAGGTNYTTATTTVTVSAGGGKATPIVGGAISTTVTVSKGGSGYVYPPAVQISAPPSPGIPAEAYCTLSANAVSTVTVTNQGAGYLSPPTVTFLNDPRDTAGTGAQGVATLTGSGAVTAIVITDHGNPVTSVPTLTVNSTGSGASATATSIMAFAITSFGVSTAGAGYSAAAGNVMVQAAPIVTAGATAYTNPAYQTGIARLRPCQVSMVTTSGGAVTTTQQVIDGGLYEAIPGVHDIGIAAADAIVTTAAILSVNVGGQNDTVLLIGC